jgi:lysophospholipase L1-like esterase
MKNCKVTYRVSAVLAAFILTMSSVTSAAVTPMKYDFGSGAAAEGYIQVLPEHIYTDESGYGFEPEAAVTGIDRGDSDALRRDFVTSDKPFLFSIRLPEGNYRVTMTLGDAEGESTTVVKAELRRLMLEKVHTENGSLETIAIVVNIRTPEIADGRKVRLKEREKTNEMAAWDDKLTLEFNGQRPCLCALEVERIDTVPTVFLLGDSTVCDQPLEPWNSWGQMLTRFFKPDVAIANHAQSGESIRSSLSAGRFDKVWSVIKPGDYMFIQFGHNDMKSRDPNALSIYTSDLAKIVAQAKNRGAIPVLVTSMERKNGVENDTLAGYPAAVRQVAMQNNAALIDLHKMSKKLYKAFGSDLDKAFQDGTHHTAYGSYQLAKCVIQGIIDNNLTLSSFIVDDFKHYDTNEPDPVGTFNVPSSPIRTMLKPLGS